MKKVFSILLLASFFICFQKDQRQMDTIHLSYNILESKKILTKYFDKKECVNFYFDDEHFESQETAISINSDDLEKIKLISIDMLIKLSNKKRKDLIKIGEKISSIKILSNSEVFENIYLYEQKNDGFFKYKVHWIDEITN